MITTKKIGMKDPIYEAVKSSFVKNDIAKQVLVALSGGSDSVALLSLTCKLKKAGLIESVEAVHINHGLRENSLLEEKQVMLLCEALSVPLHIRHVTIESGNLEAQARKARYDAFYDVAKAVNIHCIALAHHAGDVAETLLMRMVRGCGKGLAVMAEKTETENGLILWRPLLHQIPEDLKERNCKESLSWCEDESNQDVSYVRNYIRHKVIPLLESKVTNTRKNMAWSAELIRDEQHYFDDISNDFLNKHSGSMIYPWIDAKEYDILSFVLKRHVIRTFTSRIGQELTREQSLQAEKLKEGGKVNLPKGYHLERSQDRIWLIPPSDTSSLHVDITCEATLNTIGDGRFVQSMPRQVYEQCELRVRRNGDYLIPFGMTGKKSLGDYMTDRKIPRPIRDRIPLLCINDRVIWVIGCGCDELCRTGNENMVTLKINNQEDFSYGKNSNAIQ